VIAWIKIAFRNLVKNKRRSAFTGIAIALGFAAVNLFSGFTEYMYSGNRNMAIYGQANGHLTIFKEGFLEYGQLDPGKYLLTPEEIQTIESICDEMEDVLLVTPQLRISGLVTNGTVSLIFIGKGVVPSAVDEFLKRYRYRSSKITKSVKENNLRDDVSYGVAMASGLARLLDLQIGSDAVAFSNTIDGQMNALNMEIFQIFNTGSDEMNDKIMRVPLKFARELYDTHGADRLAVLLKETPLTYPVRERLQEELSKHNLSMEIKTWQEISEWYRKVKSMFDAVFAFLFVIIFVIVVMSVINTMSMAIIERTRDALWVLKEKNSFYCFRLRVHCLAFLA
jgi:putative ABC transport system permease protein